MAKDTQTRSFEAFHAVEVAAIEAGRQAGTAFTSALDTVIKANEDWEGGTFTILKAMGETYGEKLAEFPIVGDDFSNNPAIVKSIVKGTNNKDTTKTVDFWVVLADNTPRGAALVNELHSIKLMNTEDADTSGIPADFKFKYSNALARSRYETILKQRLSVVRNGIKKAASLFQQMNRINDLAKVECSPIWADADETVVISSKRPIKIWEPGSVDRSGMAINQEDFSIKSILKVDVEAAKEHGGTLEAIKHTLKRETGGTQSEATEDATPINTVNTFEERITDIHSYLDLATTDSKREKLGALLKYLNSKAGDQLVADLVDLRNMIANDILPMVKAAQERADRVREENDKVEAEINGNSKVA